MLFLDIYLLSATAIISLVMCRQLVLTMRFRLKPKDLSSAPIGKTIPRVAVMIPAHNEERVIDGCLRAMQEIDYPTDRIIFAVVNDRSKDTTGVIAERHAREDDRIFVLHRPDIATPGKPAALYDAIGRLLHVDVIVFFDADYRPPPGLLHRLVAPFDDPAVGATMGRVVPDNTDRNFLTKLIDLERRAGYGVDQTMRYARGLLPQFGGTCGAVRVSALDAVGGWKTDVLAEDTDLTYRLFIEGYKIAYVPDGHCYEESPENWQVRFRQVRRWAYGHNDCLLRYFIPTLLTRKQPLRARLDAALVLLLFLVPALAISSLFLLILSPALGGVHGAALLLPPLLVALCAIGNFAPYYQMAAASIDDGQPRACLAMPLIALSSFISMAAAISGLYQLLRDRLFGFAPKWDKTLRFRRPEVPAMSQQPAEAPLKHAA